MSNKVYETKTILTGLTFGEGPRWRNGKLYFSDFYKFTVNCFDPASGANEVILQLPKDVSSPSGLGWLPDGRMLVVSMQDMKLLVVENGKASEYADLKSICEFWPNDMITAKNGTCYVGNFGFDLGAVRAQGLDVEQHMKPGTLAIVRPDGSVSKGPGGMMFANGPVITPDGKVFIVAETFANRLSMFDIEEDGSLTNRRVFAETPGTRPDGICLCEDGSIWVGGLRWAIHCRLMHDIYSW
jgi:sugar lactone lactonase YvrE